MTRIPQTDAQDLQSLLEHRYSDAPRVPDGLEAAPLATLNGMAGRGACRAFREDQVPEDVLELICATALASPTKSDLQQRDIIVVEEPRRRAALAALAPGQDWVAQAPVIAVFCGNNRRQRLLHHWRGVHFANDHFDAVFNATADAAIALGACVTAAEALGLGCCPISALRNEARAVSELLALPEFVFPLAGLAIGYPAGPTTISKRLPLAATLHRERYDETRLRAQVSTYDADRAAHQPYAKERSPELFEPVSPYTWSEDKLRQYSRKERADFGAYIRAQGFRLT